MLYEIGGGLLLLGIGWLVGIYWSATRYEPVIDKLRSELATYEAWFERLRKAGGK